MLFYIFLCLTKTFAKGHQIIIECCPLILPFFLKTQPLISNTIRCQCLAESARRKLALYKFLVGEL